MNNRLLSGQKSVYSVAMVKSCKMLAILIK